MSTAAALTVVVPVWDDYVDFLPDCLAALPDEADVVVVDNRSARAMPAATEHAHVVRLARRSTAGGARNAGLAHVTTPLVAFVDADDVPLPGALERLAVTVAARPDAVGAIGRLVSWDAERDVRVLSQKLPRPATIRAARHRRLFALGNAALNTFPIAGGVFRADAVRAAGGYGDASVGEDWILGAALCFQGRILLLDEPTMLRRLHGTSLWHRPHTRDEIRARTAEVRRRLRSASGVPAHGRLAAAAVRPLHELLAFAVTRRGPQVPRTEALS